MTDGFTIDLSVKAEKVLAQLDHLPKRMGAKIAQAMDKENELTIAHTQRNRLTGYGPFPEAQHRLGNRPGLPGSGSLRQSVNATESIVTGDDVVSAIGASVSYAWTHEFGFSGDVQVRAFVRHGGMKDTFKIGGVEMSRRDAIMIKALLTKTQLRAGMRAAGNNWKSAASRNKLKALAALDRRQEKWKTATSFGQVRAHKRHLNLPPRAPIQHGILDRVANYSRAISRAIVDASKEGDTQ